MRKNKFAKLLLTGKIATLPMLIGQVRADVTSVTPTYTDMIGSTLRVIEVPSGTGIRLSSIAADSGGSYAGGSAAYLCTNESLPSSMTIVVTGVKSDEGVILAGSRNKNDPLHLAVDQRMTIGSQGLSILGSAQVSSLYGATAGATVGGTVTISLPTATLTALAGGTGKLYLQAVVLPAGGSTNLANWRFSELDEVSVGTCATSPYSTSSY